MATGIELIQKERDEQIKKHKYSKAHDRRINSKSELARAALYCQNKGEWPVGWSLKSKAKIDGKSIMEKLIVAGAFYMAEQDRLGMSHYYATEIKDLARQIDKFLKPDFNGNS